MQKKCKICKIREICRICKVSKICIKCKTCKIFLFQKILIFLLLRSSYFSFSVLHLINHEVQNPMSPFNLADLFSPRIWSSCLCYLMRFFPALSPMTTTCARMEVNFKKQLLYVQLEPTSSENRCSYIPKNIKIDKQCHFSGCLRDG